jgi:type IX secretion system PorP/SprF family membrane protein
MHLVIKNKTTYFAQSLQLNFGLRKVIMFFLLMLCRGYVFSQSDMMFSQTAFNPAFVNPGYAGSDTSNYYNVIAMSRILTSGLEKAPNVTILNVNGPLHIGSAKGGVSFSFCNDQSGFLSTPAFNLGYAYKTRLGKGSLGLGLSAGVFFSTLESEGWVLPDGNTDPLIPTGKNSKQSFDLGLGLYYAGDRFYAGLSVTHLVRPTMVQGDNAVRVPRNYYLMAGYRLALDNPDIEIRPSALMLTDLGTFGFSMNALLFYRNKLWAGLDYRIKNSLALVAGMNILPDLRLGYSYGYNTALLSRFSGGNHEIMLTYKFFVYINREKLKYKSIRYL